MWIEIFWVSFRLFFITSEQRKLFFHRPVKYFIMALLHNTCWKIQMHKGHMVSLPTKRSSCINRSWCWGNTRQWEVAPLLEKWQVTGSSSRCWVPVIRCNHWASSRWHVLPARGGHLDPFLHAEWAGSGWKWRLEWTRDEWQGGKAQDESRKWSLGPGGIGWGRNWGLLKNSDFRRQASAKDPELGQSECHPPSFWDIGNGHTKRD